MDSTPITKLVRMPSFSGLREDFQTWWIRFVAYANVCKFLGALKKGGEASMPSSDAVVIDIATEQGKMVAKAKERNSLAMANLTMAFETENLFGLIYKTMSTDWPGGLAHEVVVQLFNKYSSPDDRISRVELRTMLNGVSMRDTEDTERSEARFQGNCRDCGKQGHKERNCWQKEENKSNRPQGYKMPNEVANLSLDNNKTIEYLLCGLTNPTENKILLDPNVWIADTAASVHATAHKEGLQGINETRTTVMMSNGKTETTTENGTLEGTICDQHGNELNKAMIENVSYLPNRTFNLFSMTQMMAKGWTIGGDKNSIWIKKDQKKVIFDIKISTPDGGTLFAMNFIRKIETSNETKSLEVGEGMKNIDFENLEQEEEEVFFESLEQEEEEVFFESLEQEEEEIFFESLE
jgi:hypothetical protein